METQRLTTEFWGHKVEVTLNLPEGCDKRYSSVPFSILDDFSERIEGGTRNGLFENLPDDELETEGKGFFLSGSWHIVEIDYQKISRVLLWEYNFVQDEALSEDLFVRYFGGVMGRHYYEKWSRVYDHDLRLMLAYFGYNIHEGQRFCDMIDEQVRRYEERTSQNDRT